MVELWVVLGARLLSVRADSWSWKLSSEGVYSVRFAYDSLLNYDKVDRRKELQRFMIEDTNGSRGIVGGPIWVKSLRATRS